MAVKIGSARIDEHGNASGGAAGDQTGREVSTQDWYLHKKGWRVLRCIDPGRAGRIAEAMLAACKNPKIGYDQGQRLTLYNLAKAVGFDPARVATKCETDCSALVRVCLAFAGIMVGNFRTTNEAKVILASGMFVELTASKYTTGSAYLRKGDVLVTRTQGHTVVVLTDGPKAERNVPPPASAPGPGAGGLRRGDGGAAVTAMQLRLLKWDPACLPGYGADGDFGPETERAVAAFQRAASLPVTGIYDAATAEQLLRKVASAVEITGGTVNVRSGPGTHYRVLGTVGRGAQLEYQGMVEMSGDVPWYLVAYTLPGDATASNAWVSGRYGRLVET